MITGYSPIKIPCCERDTNGDGNCDRHPPRRPPPPTSKTCLPLPTTTVATEVFNEWRDAHHAAARSGIREGETLAEFIRRLYEETTADED